MRRNPENVAETGRLSTKSPDSVFFAHGPASGGTSTPGGTRRLSEKNPPACYLRAVILIDVCDGEKAAADPNAAIGLDPEDAEAHPARGVN